MKMTRSQKKKLKCVLSSGCKTTGRLAIQVGDHCEYCAVGQILHEVGVPDDVLMRYTSIMRAIDSPSVRALIPMVNQEFGMDVHELSGLEGVNDNERDLGMRRQKLSEHLDKKFPDEEGVCVDP